MHFNAFKCSSSLWCSCVVKLDHLTQQRVFEWIDPASKTETVLTVKQWHHDNSVLTYNSILSVSPS